MSRLLSKQTLKGDRTGLKSFIRQKLFQCQNHRSNSWNELHDTIVGDHKGRIFIQVHS